MQVWAFERYISLINIKYVWTQFLTSTLPQTALSRDCNGKCIEIIEGHYLEVVVLL